MSRTSKRKAAVNRAKLASSIRPAQMNVQMKMMELLEERTLFTAIPSPIPGSVLNLSVIQGLGGTNGIADSFSSAQNSDDSTAPSVAVDLNDPQKLVAVWTSHHTTGKIPFEVFAAFSINGGGSWTGFNLAPQDFGLDNDPDLSTPTKGVPYTHSKDVSVAIDRSDQVYVVFRELNAAENGGEIVLQKFDFSLLIAGRGVQSLDQTCRLLITAGRKRSLINLSPPGIRRWSRWLRWTTIFQTPQQQLTPIQTATLSFRPIRLPEMSMLHGRRMIKSPLP